MVKKQKLSPVWLFCIFTTLNITVKPNEEFFAYLPKDKQEELTFLVGEILKRLPQAEYIILYDSYVRDSYVHRGIRVEEGGIPTVKISDYDILVITSGISSKRAETVLDNMEEVFFAGKDFERDTPVQLFNDDIKHFNLFIEEGWYFYTQLKEVGVVLYSSGRYKLARRRKLNFDEIKEQHNLSKLSGSTKRYSEDLKTVFPQDTPE